MIPEEDRHASWLSGSGGVEADIRQLRDFAEQLRAEVESSYAPHLRYIADDMLTAVPNPADAFVELVLFMRTHWETQQATTNAVWGAVTPPATSRRPRSSWPISTPTRTLSPPPASPTSTEHSRSGTPRHPSARRSGSRARRQPRPWPRHRSSTRPHRQHRPGGGAMREPGVGRSGGLTEWHLMNVADMWACLQGHHTDNHWRHVAGWRKIAELSGQHLGRLRTYRERLAQAWPPETNAASHAYLVKLDELIEQVQRTHDAAATNQTALSAATLALSSSRDKIEKIHQEYADKLQQKRSWEQTAADPKAAAASRAIQSPVTDSDLEQLNTQARNIMYGLSTELQQAQTQLRHPPPTARPSFRQMILTCMRRASMSPSFLGLLQYRHPRQPRMLHVRFVRHLMKLKSAEP